MRYGGFRLIGHVYGIAAVLMAILALVFGVWYGVAAGGWVGILFGVALGAVTSFFTFLFLYAISRFILVVLDIEDNTRAIRATLSRESKEGE